MTDHDTTHDDPAPAEAPAPGPTRSRPSETLPTERIAFAKQLNLLLAYGAIYDQTNEAVTNAEAGKAVGLSASTTSLANAFFADVGFLTRSDGGYVPTPAVLDYYRVHAYDVDAAARELAEVLKGTWFASALLPKLSVGPMSEQAALAELGKRANARPHYRPQLRMLVDYLVSAGLMTQDGDQLRRVSGRPPKDPRNDPEARDNKLQRELHPFVQGLLQELPPTGTVWPENEQKAWLEGWEVAFRFLYKTGADPPKARRTTSSDGGGESG